MVIGDFQLFKRIIGILWCSKVEHCTCYNTWLQAYNIILPIVTNRANLYLNICDKVQLKIVYSKPCVKRPLKNRQNKDLNDKL